MNKSFDIAASTAKAIDYFWRTKSQQLKRSADSSNRGSVVAGKQLDGFLTMLKQACLAIGVPEECIFDSHNYLPGYFRASKDWDFIIISPSGKLLVVIELKSQTGSYGNNFNNRAEEALGSSTDFWTAYREQEFPTCGTPWIGYLMVLGDDEKSNMPVRNYTDHYPVLPEFEQASYVDRYRILCKKMMSERAYTATCLILTHDRQSFRDASEELSISRFIHSLQGYLIGCENEFNK